MGRTRDGMYGLRCADRLGEDMIELLAGILYGVFLGVWVGYIWGWKSGRGSYTRIEREGMDKMKIEPGQFINAIFCQEDSCLTSIEVNGVKFYPDESQRFVEPCPNCGANVVSGIRYPSTGQAWILECEKCLYRTPGRETPGEVISLHNWIYSQTKGMGER
jgi:hypothetical protein